MAKAAPIRVTYADGSVEIKEPREFPRAKRPNKRYAKYRAYLDSPQWQEKRQAALRKAGYRCEFCLTAESLHVHHPSYHNLYREGARHLVVLCADCHAKVHGKRRKRSA